jgi:hypothetical protein
LSGVVKDKVLELCAKSKQWKLLFKHPTGHKTSNHLDHLMRGQNQYFERGQHCHKTIKAANKRSRAYAILYNYWDWTPTTVKKQKFRCLAEKLNKK